jgi:hypothetical protein
LLPRVPRIRFAATKAPRQLRVCSTFPVEGPVWATHHQETRGTMPDDEIPFPRRSGAGRVNGAPACTARRVCVGDAGAGIQRPLLGKSQCDGAAELQPGVASAVCSQARFFALRVLLRIGIGGRLAECVIASGTAGGCGSIASARDTRVGHGHGRFAPALARTSQSFLIG